MVLSVPTLDERARSCVDVLGLGVVFPTADDVIIGVIPGLPGEFAVEIGRFGRHFDRRSVDVDGYRRGVSRLGHRVEVVRERPEQVEPPTVYHCDSCDEWVFHNAVLGGGAVVVDEDSLLLVEDFHGPGTWTIPEGVPEIPESPREGVARELEEQTGLVVDPTDLVYCYDVGKWVGEDMVRMHIYYAVERHDTTGTVEAGSDATDPRFWTPTEFEDSDQVLRDMPNPVETRSWDMGPAVLRDQSQAALDGQHTYAELFDRHLL